jgi:outer membrane protein OmpA-like peptidoglycan-associated protein
VARGLQARLNDHPKKSKPVTIYEQNVKWFGSAGPIACNADDKGAPDEHGRALNRRVEVWVR